NQGYQAVEQGRNELDGAGGPRDRDVRLLHLRRGPAVPRLRREAESGRPRLRGVRAGHARNGRGAEDQCRAGERADAGAAGEDFEYRAEGEIGADDGKDGEDGEDGEGSLAEPLRPLRLPTYQSFP